MLVYYALLLRYDGYVDEAYYDTVGDIVIGYAS